MDIESAAPPCTDAVVMDALNARLRATPVDADCLVAALLLLVEQRGISGVARSCGMSNATFRRQFRNARDLPFVHPGARAAGVWNETARGNPVAPSRARRAQRKAGA
jgi:hypothetical protein